MSARALFLLPRWFAVILWSEQTHVSCRRRLIWCGCSPVRVNNEHEQCCHVLTYQHNLIHKRLHRLTARVFQSHNVSMFPKHHGFCNMVYKTFIVPSQLGYILARKLLNSLLLRFGKTLWFGSKWVYYLCTLTTILYITYITLVLSSKVKSSQMTFTFTSSCLLGESPLCADFLTLYTTSPDFLL